MRGNFVLSDELREVILFDFEHHLRAQDSLILDSVDNRKRMVDQVQSILDDIKACAGQAFKGMPPVEPLHAASVLFETALPVVLRASAAVGRPDTEIEAALALH